MMPTSKQANEPSSEPEGREGACVCAILCCFSFLTFALRVCMRMLWIIDRMTTKTCLHIRIYYTYAFFLPKQTWKIFSDGDGDDGGCNDGIVTFVSNLLVCELVCCWFFSCSSHLSLSTAWHHIFFAYFITFRRMKHILRYCQCFLSSFHRRYARLCTFFACLLLSES